MLYNAICNNIYSNGVASKNAVFWDPEPASFIEAVAVARFAHAYDVPHALRHVEAYLTAHVKACYARLPE